MSKRETVSDVSAYQRCSLRLLVVQSDIEYRALFVGFTALFINLHDSFDVSAYRYRSLRLLVVVHSDIEYRALFIRYTALLIDLHDSFDVSAYRRRSPCLLWGGYDS